VRSPEELDARYAHLTAVFAGHLPASRAALDEWHAQLALELVGASASEDRILSVSALAALIKRDGIVRMHVEQMLDQALHIRHEPGEPVLASDVPELLAVLDHIVKLAPPFAPPPSGPHAFPMSNLFVYMMMTPAGEAAFRLPAFNDALRAITAEWCQYLDSPDSANVLNEGPAGWLSEAGYKYCALDQFVIPDRAKPHWGWGSYNAFFHREVKASERPIADPGDPKVIVSANDGTLYAIARGVKATDSFWLKGQPYSLVNILNADEERVRQFAGGDVFQSFLSGSNYHRWHAPIDGIVRSAELVEGLMFSDLEAAGYDIDAGVKSLGYEASVNTRGLVYVESPDPKIGTVCVIPIGITEISSITFSVKAGDEVTKGQELGRFSYGGSTLAVLFQPGAVSRFTAGTPEKRPAIKVNAQIAIAN